MTAFNMGVFKFSGGLRERSARNGAAGGILAGGRAAGGRAAGGRAKSWGVPRSPRVLPRQGIDDESVLKAMVVASVIGTVIAIALSLLLYGLYQLWRRGRRGR